MRRLLTVHGYARIVVYSRDEVKQYDMRRALEKEFPQSADRLRFFLGDVRDEKRLARVLLGNSIDHVVHAAALKQIPATEYSPLEAVKTNVGGAVNLIEAALDCSVKKVIALSSDKANQALNLYGATKMVMEKLLIQANGFRPTRFACVRYGNVVGSRGSVIPLWREQTAKHPLNQAPITITDPNMTRFWITLEQGVQFVISSLELMQGGEVFVPKLPACTIGELAKTVAPIAPQNIVGLRPGEKMHETLISQDEARQTRDLGDRYVIYPAIHEFALVKRGKRVLDDFEFTSRTAPRIGGKELETMCRSV